jgi:hypothetical protein
MSFDVMCDFGVRVRLHLKNLRGNKQDVQLSEALPFEGGMVIIKSKEE